jgi:hypothetical protein
VIASAKLFNRTHVIIIKTHQSNKAISRKERQTKLEGCDFPHFFHECFYVVNHHHPMNKKQQLAREAFRWVRRHGDRLMSSCEAAWHGRWQPSCEWQHNGAHTQRG